MWQEWRWLNSDWFIYFPWKMFFTSKSFAAGQGTKLTRDDTNCSCDRADTPNFRDHYVLDADYLPAEPDVT